MDEYYLNQAGSGISGFQGIRYQKGNGFMGRVISGALMPILRKVLPYLGKTALSAGANIMQDYENGASFSESAKNRLKQTKAEIRRKSLEKFKELTGGRRAKNKRTTCASSKKKSNGKKSKQTKSKAKKGKKTKAKSKQKATKSRKSTKSKTQTRGRRRALEFL